MFVKMTLVMVTIISITFFGISTLSGHPSPISPAVLATTVIPSGPTIQSTPVISTPSASTTKAAVGDNKLFLPSLWSYIAPTITPSPTVTTTPVPPANGIFVNHSSVAQFASIPNDKILAASNLRMLFMHKSVGEGISLFMDCLQGTLWQCDSDPKYDRSKWNWPLFESTNNSDNFAFKKAAFDNAVNSQNGSYDVFGYKLCYIDNMDGSISAQDKFTQYRDEMLALEAQYPTKRFIWSTQALWAETDSNADSQTGQTIQTYNTLVRSYAYANGKILFDIADIESHTNDGTACYSTSTEALCGIYSDGGSGGHQNQDGYIRSAQAVWVLMAKIAGWQP